MYIIINVIYGVPLAYEAGRKIDEWEQDESHDKWFEDERGPCGFTALYHGASDTHVGYCGVELDSFDEVQPKLVSGVRVEPTEEEKAEAAGRIAKLDPELRALCPEVGVYFVASSS